jgi:hypothetical protein
VVGHGFPADIMDDEPEEAGHELMVSGRQDD